MAKTPLILASASPRRRELLERVGIVVEVLPADVDETAHDGEDAVVYAQRIALSKAQTVAANVPDRWLLAADTVVEIDGAILGKPADVSEAGVMLRRLLGRSHRVTTAFVVMGPTSHLIARVVTTEVVMRKAAETEARAYLTAGEWQGKAGGYAVQGMAAAFVTEVRGSITNVIGLPLAEVLVELSALGVAEPNYCQGVPA